MKKLLFAIIFILYAFLLSAQSFYKGALVFDVKGAIDIYDTKFKQKDLRNGRDTTTEDKAANRNISFGLEYGIMDKLGVGIRYKYNKYFVQADDSTKKLPNVNSSDIAVLVNYHILNKNVFNLLAGINIGYTNLKLFTNNINDDRFYANGLYFDFHVTPRVWIKRFGFEFDIAVPFANYTKLTSNNQNYNENYSTKFRYLGYSVGLGIQYRFLKKKEQSAASLKTTD
jgi:hypothetical protein